jgi:hypothetical protein
MGRGQESPKSADHSGVTFELAALAFGDEACLVAPDRIDRVTGEQRRRGSE